MRKILVFLLMVFCVRISYSQDIFTVIKVSGNIVIERTGSPLGTGTSFAQTENLLFKVPDSRAAVINPKRGRFILTPQNFAEFRSSKSNYLPSASKITMRAVGIDNKKDVLKRQFEGEIVILDENKIVIDTTVYPMSASKYFYIMYNYNNRTINKRLAFSRDTLLINRNELLAVNGQIISGTEISQMELMYFKEGEINGTARISIFKPVFPDKNVLSNEIKIILDQLEMNPYSDKLRETSAFITEFYGKVDENSLKNWLSDIFNLQP